MSLFSYDCLSSLDLFKNSWSRACDTCSFFLSLMDNPKDCVSKFSKLFDDFVADDRDVCELTI